MVIHNHKFKEIKLVEAGLRIISQGSSQNEEYATTVPFDKLTGIGIVIDPLLTKTKDLPPPNTYTGKEKQ